jgi:hypothetical protein
MPLLTETHVQIPNKDILSWTYDDPQFDHNILVKDLGSLIDALD